MEEKNKTENVEKDEEIIAAKKEKIFNFLKNNPNLIFIGFLILLIIFGAYIRNLPLSDHNGKPGLWDITTNDYTLGPDLDPFLFLRYAKTIITNGGLPQIDMMRNVPLGFDNSLELPMVGYAIVWTYKLVNLFGNYSINFAGAFMPVLAFILTIITFFFFVKEIFIRKNDKKSELKANVIALISTLFMIVIPEFLPRTVAGIPEKESIGFLFMFLAFFLYLKAWKAEKLYVSVILGTLAGLATGLMNLSWGGVLYAYVTISTATFIAFLLNKINIKEALIYWLWLFFSLALTLLVTNRSSLLGFVTSLDTGLASFTFIVLIVYFIVCNKKIESISILKNIRLPKNIFSIIVTIVVGLLLISMVFGPSFIIQKFADVNRIFFNPLQGRWVTTVAENRQPYFIEWGHTFGPMIGNFPVIFWLFIAGSLVLFRQMTNKMKNKDSWILTGTYALFLITLIFSRYSASSLFNGENFISKFVYFASGLMLAGIATYYYIKYYKEKNQSLELLEFEYLFLFVLLILCLFTARAAIRLIMVLAPIVPILLAFLLVYLVAKFASNKDSINKVLIGIAAILIILLTIYSFMGYYNSTKNQAYNSVPYYYTLQWQEAMSWVRDNTPINSVFAHWWDYGYWLQSIGNRATVTDGGNAIVWWNYLTGRLVLTGNNQQEALNFLYSHNATHLLIDSSDIGKYGAFSQIGSDENFDRLSQGPITLISDQKQIQETKNENIRLYNIPAGNGRVSLIPLEEDIIYENESGKITLFKENSALMAISIRYIQSNDSMVFKQPQAVFYSNNRQIVVPIRYFYYNNNFKDYKEGINATAYIIQRVYSSASGLQLDNMGAMIYLSPRIMRGMLGQVYVLNDPFKKWSAFKLVHNEPDYILSQISAQGANLGEFTYYEGLRGPIKIWNITYTGDEQIKEEYLSKTPASYITWKF